MDFGEQTTGTRDEQYNLISVLYHALHGAETVEAYVLDAEAAGDERLAEFFREAWTAYRQLAERAKGLLGIEEGGVVPEAAGGAILDATPVETEVFETEIVETGVPPDDAEPVDVRGRVAPEVGLSPESGTILGEPRPGEIPEPDVPVDETGATPEEAPPTTEVPRTPPSATAPPDEGVVVTEPEVEPASVPPEAKGTREYQQTQTIAASPEEVFAWLSDVGNLPEYLPPITGASIEGPSAEGSPGEKIRLQGHIPNRGPIDGEGYFHIDEAVRGMEWGAEVSWDYSGWLTVAESGDGQSEVTVHLSFGPRSVEGEIQEDTPEGHDPLEEGVSATLESIRRQIEEGSGKVEPTPPPPPAE